MEIDKDKIQKIIDRLSQPQDDMQMVITELKELINEKWIPSKTIAGYPEEIFKAFFDMQERNERIFLAKHEMGYGDGTYSIAWFSSSKRWSPYGSFTYLTPELTFETKDQAKKIISMVGLND